MNHERAAEELRKASSGGKGVCAKTLSHGDVAWKCETCEKDPTCIICQECFELGDHKGHKVWLKRNVGGCCDCGDPDAWAESGFCKKHKGYEASADTLLEQLPAFIKKAAKFVFDHVCFSLKAQTMALQTHLSRSSGYKGFNSDKKAQLQVGKSLIILDMFFDFMDWSVELSPAFIHFLAQSTFKTFIRQIRKLDKEQSGLGLQKEKGEDERIHKCCVKSFVDDEESKAFGKEMTDLIVEEDGRDSIYLTADITVAESQNCTFSEETLAELRAAKSLCTCTVLDLTFQSNHIILEKTRKTQHDLYFKMFQSFRFKQQLGLSFAANFAVVQTESDDKVKHRIGGIGVQLLTTDDISLMIMKSPNLREHLLSTYAKQVKLLVENDFSEADQHTLYMILYDFKYMARTKSLKFAIEETSFVESLLEPLQQLYYVDRQQLRKEHIMFDQSIFKDGLYNMEIFLTKICKSFLKAVSPTDGPRNSKIMAAFLRLFEEVGSKMPASGQEGFFAIPLHRAFSFYFTRLIFQNYLNEVESYKASGKTDKDLLLDILKRFIPTPSGQNTWRYLQSLIDMIIRPLARSWAFTHEVASGKWVMSGMFINQIPKLHCSVYEYYLLLDIGLFQTLLAVSPEPHRTLETVFSSGFGADEWLKKFQILLIQQKEFDQKSFFSQNNFIDDKKIRQLLHWELRLIVQLAVTETAFIWPLLTNLSPKDNLTYSLGQTQCNKSIEKIYRNDMRRSLVHALVLLGGKTNVKQIKQQLEETDIYTESEFFEDELLTVASQHREGGKIVFKLKEETYLSWFDPYFYLQPKQQAKVHEVFQGAYQDKKLVNEVLGDFNSTFKFGTGVNQVIRDGLAQTSLIIKLTAAVLRLWCRPEEATKVVDDQIGFESLKIMHLIAQGQMSPTSKEAFIESVKEDDWALVRELRDKGQKLGQVVEKAVRELLLAFYSVDKPQLEYIGQMLGFAMTGDLKIEDASMLSEEPQVQDLKRQKSQQVKAALLKKFGTMREDFISKQQGDSLSGSSSAASFRKDIQDEAAGELECSLCKEILSLDHYYASPFGQFAYVSNSKLLYHSYRQTLSRDRPAQHPPTESSEELKESEMPEETYQDPMVDELINCLQVRNGTGGTLVKCAHYAHSKCLIAYLTANESDSRKRDMRKIIGLDFDTFQCPLCKHVANVLLPCDQLTGYQDQKVYQHDFNQYELLEFHTRMLSKIVQKQEWWKKDLLPVDIRRDPRFVLQAVQRFIEHRVQLIDVKGISEFLSKKSSHNSVTKEHYADILNLTSNVIHLIMDGYIPVSYQGKDAEMTEETVQDICNQEILGVLECRKGWKLMLSDFSSVALQLIYWGSMLSGLHQLNAIEVIVQKVAQAIIEVFKLQLGIKVLYQRQKLEGIDIANQGFSGTPAFIYSQLSSSTELLTLAGFGKEPTVLVDQLVTPPLLCFLRKLAAFKLLLHSACLKHALSQSELDESALSIKEADEKFISALAKQVDNNEECHLLTDYLQLQKTISQEELAIIPEELLSVLNYFEDQQQQADFLESYALSSLNQVVNPKQEIEDGKRNIIKDGILSHTGTVTLHIPSQIMLIEPPRFKLEDLPGDFQTLVQTFYKRKCLNCKKQPKESCICLLCGRVVCFLQKCCQGVLPGMKQGEGELSYHARTCEGGQALFLSTSNGKIIMVDDEKSCQRTSFYVNKFGETFSQSSKRWDNYHLQDTALAGVGESYKDFRRIYLDFSLPNEVIKSRTMTDSVWRPRVI